MLLALIAASLVAALHLSTGPKVSIGPAALTYPEIAAALSAEGRTVQCATSIRNRAAVVALRDRTWAGACAALSQGLDIRVRAHPDLPNTWLMEPDPGVAAREKVMRHELGVLLREGVAEEVKPYSASLQTPIHLLLARSVLLKRELESREKLDPEHKQPRTAELARESEDADRVADPFIQIAARLAATARPRDYEEAIAGPLPFQSVDIHRLANVPAICRLMLEEMERTAAASPPETQADANSNASPFAGSNGLVALIRQVADGHISLAERLRFDPGSLRITVQQLYLLGDVFPLRHGISADPTGDKGIYYVIARMDEAARKSVERENEDTAHWLATPAARAELSVSTSDRITSLSQLVERWARQSGGDVVMELVPLREAIDLSPPADESGDNESSAEPPAEIHTSLAAKVGRESGSPWSCRESDGVLLVRDRLAFIDRTRRFPLRALLALERDAPRLPSAEASDSLLSLSQLVRFQSACTAEENGELSLIPAYRGLDVANVTPSRFAAVLARLSRSESEAAARTLEATGRVDIRLAGFSGREIQSIVATLRSNALASENGTGDEWRIPAFERQLWSGCIRLEQQDNGLTITLLLPPVDGSEELDTVLSTSLARDPRR
jgi:hypothetical protein